MIIKRWAGTAALIAAAIGIGMGIGNAALAQPKAGTVIAQSEIAVANPITAAADLPRAIRVSGAAGKPVTFVPPKGKPITVTSAANTPTIARDLTAGRNYAIRINGQRVGTAMPVTAVARPTALRVMAGAQPGTAVLTWSHAFRAAQGGVVFDVTVVPVSGPGQRITLLVPGHSAVITGLDPALRYAFHVSARNSASRSAAIVATMATPLLAVVTRPAELQPAPVAPNAAQPSAAPTPPGASMQAPGGSGSAAPPAAAPAPQAPPAPPRTRTVWTCPEGAVMLSTTCTTTKQYTFQTETAPYTYQHQSMSYTTHSETRSAGECSYLPNPNSPTGLDIYCPTYTVDVRNPTPAGWTDNGQMWVRSVRESTPSGWTDTGSLWTRQAKDATPTGFTDTGTEWRKVEPATSHEVPA
jgi:hypothetical protein